MSNSDSSDQSKLGEPPNKIVQEAQDNSLAKEDHVLFHGLHGSKQQRTSSSAAGNPL